jgi:hypothetical protein
MGRLRPSPLRTSTLKRNLSLLSLVASAIGSQLVATSVK